MWSWWFGGQVWCTEPRLHLWYDRHDRQLYTSWPVLCHWSQCGNSQCSGWFKLWMRHYSVYNWNARYNYIVTTLYLIFISLGLFSFPILFIHSRWCSGDTTSVLSHCTYSWHCVLQTSGRGGCPDMGEALLDQWQSNNYGAQLARPHTCSKL